VDSATVPAQLGRTLQHHTPLKSEEPEISKEILEEYTLSQVFFIS